MTDTSTLVSDLHKEAILSGPSNRRLMRKAAFALETNALTIEELPELIAAAKDARDFLWAKSNLPEYRDRANRLTKALQSLNSSPGSGR